MPAGDITQGYTFVPAEKNIDAPKMNAIVGQASINPVFVSGQVQASSTAAGDYFLLYKANGTLAKILYDDLASSLAAATGFQQQVWAVRLRSFNAIGNPNFEVDQRNAGTAVGMNQLAQDRWAFYKTGMTTAGWTAGQQTPTSRIQVPGTSFSISRTFIRLTLTTPQSTLAAGDFTYGIHQVEGPSFRELQDDVHSLQLLVRSSVAPVSFGVALTDQAPPTRTLTKLCTIPVANTWTLIQLPNLPIWPPTGNFQSDAGVAGYQLRFLFACGTGSMSPANDTWQNGNFFGAPGMSNFAANVANSTFDIAFVQHEPGPQCTTLIDKPFTQNLDECLRYYTKSYLPTERPGTASASGIIVAPCAAGSGITQYQPFKKLMAKSPTMAIYSYVTGAANTARDMGSNSDRTVTSVGQISQHGFGIINLSTTNPAISWYAYAYIADTGF